MKNNIKGQSVVKQNSLEINCNWVHILYENVECSLVCRATVYNSYHTWNVFPWSWGALNLKAASLGYNALQEIDSIQWLTSKLRAWHVAEKSHKLLVKAHLKSFGFLPQTCGERFLPWPILQRSLTYQWRKHSARSYSVQLHLHKCWK